MNDRVRKTRILFTMSIAILVVAGTALIAAGKGNDSKRLPKSLDKMIAKALESNPEILLARAQVRQAEAELNQVRLRVTRDVTRVFSERKRHELVIHTQKERYKLALGRYKSGVADEKQMNDAMLELAKADGQISEFDAELRYLLGMGGKSSLSLGKSRSARARDAEPVPAPRPRPAPGGEFDQILDMQVSVRFNETPIAQVFEHFGKTLGDRHTFLLKDSFDKDWKITIELPPNVTLRQALLALHDRFDIAFIIRDYGFLVVNAREKQARQISGPAIPPDLPVGR